MTPAQRHRARHLAMTAAAIAAPSAGGVRARSGAPATEYELQRASLGVDLRRLKEIQSIERKIELKRELLPNYVPWVTGVLAADTGAHDDIVTHMMIWSIDIGQYADALSLAEYCVRHELPLPERFDRTTATLIVEEIADAALKSLGQGETFDIAVLEHVEGLAHDQDMPDQVRAKLEKAIGLVLARSAEAIEAGADGPAGAKRAALERALSHLRRALELDSSSGVKKRIEQLVRTIKALTPTEETP